MSHVSLSVSLKNWLFRLRGPEPAPIVLVQRRIFVLPTGAGMLFAACLLAMLAGSINYALGLGFALTFLLAGMGVVVILHTFRNLAHLHISPGRCEPVFAGQTARFILELTNERTEGRYALVFRPQAGQATVGDVPAQADGQLELAIPAARRGRMQLGRVTVETRYPLGLVRAWSYIEPEMSCLVYPAPEPSAPPLPPPTGGIAGTGHGLTGSDDFAGLRGHQPADSPRHIAWKSAARGAPLLTKQFTGGGGARLWLDWDELPRSLDVEARLSRLTRWVLDARQQGLEYGLRIPGRELPPGGGEAQFREALEALALYEHP